MSTTTAPTTDREVAMSSFTVKTPTYEDLIEMFVDAGFEPTDEAPAEWLFRYDAYMPHQGGYVVAFTPDPEAEVLLQVLTASGVIVTEARFNNTELGRRMFAAAVASL